MILQWLAFFSDCFDVHPHFQLKKEQELKKELAEREGILRTKAMREREEQKSRRKYRYCLIRFSLLSSKSRT